MSVTPLHHPDPDLARLTLADQIRYACTHMNAPVTVAGVRAWLGEHGVPVPDKRRPYVSRVVNAWRAEQSAPTTSAVHEQTPVHTVHTPTPAPVHAQTPVHPPDTVHTPTPTTHPHHARSRVPSIALITPLLLVNSVAVYGQAAWALDHVTAHLVIAIGFAAAIESIGIYLAAEAHSALMAGDAAARLRLASYLVGLLAGALNYAHFAPTFTPTAEAVTFGVLSALSPWLWAIRSRSLSRAQLRAQGLIDPRSVKFTAAQWLWFPTQSLRALRAAVWIGETNPTRARALVVQGRHDMSSETHHRIGPDQ